MDFEKWQGLGNDYVVVDRADLPAPLSPGRAALLSDRHFGVGGDGVLEVSEDDGTPRMTVWNPDGSQAENCGNGVRMVARHLADAGRLGGGTILTGGGPVAVTIRDDGLVSVDMGRATFPTGEVRSPLAVGGRSYDVAEVSMGNPHAVITHPDPDAVVEVDGPRIENDARFPERINVEFIRADGPDEITMRVWERGVGQTLACGTGACAAAAAAVRLDGARSPLTVHLLGGDLEIGVDDHARVTMTGPAALIYRGALSDELRQRYKETA